MPPDKPLHLTASPARAAPSRSGSGGDGRVELYKTSAMHEGPVGREQHRFPNEEELSA
ncbi:MAG: hypothetical protein ACRD26_08340 [Vicinamibacterales bacterium]